MRGPGFPIFAQGDDSGVPRQPTRDMVPSSYVQNAVQTVQSNATLLTAAIVIATIWFLGKRG